MGTQKSDSELEERRAQFLSSRCKEKQYFGMGKEEIITWQMYQSLEFTPDMPTWTRILQHNADMVGSDVGNSHWTELMYLYGMPAKVALHCFPERKLSSVPNIQGILEVFENVIGLLENAFITDSGVMLISPDKTSVLHVVGNERGGSYVTNILRSHVLFSALHTWQHVCDTDRGERARNFLCGFWLERRIQYVLDEAGKEFENANAENEFDEAEAIERRWNWLKDE